MDHRVQQILTWLERNPRAPLRVQPLAAWVGLSPSRLSHLFRAQTHTSVRDYLHQQRLHAAAHALRHSHERISTIAFQAGFNDASNFTHAFKKRYGMSPREYRRGGAAEEPASPAIGLTEPTKE
jgi:AraC family transcriptional regulator of arabinose operon